MRNLRQAFLTTAWRGLKGMVVGAGTCLLVAVVICLMFAVLGVRRRDLELPILTSLLVGGIAGLAARLPRNGARLATSIAVVGVCTALPALLVTNQPRHYSGPKKLDHDFESNPW